MSQSITDNTPGLKPLARTPPRNFRDLPKEVRNKIYYFLFEKPVGVCYQTDQPISV
jgi:hypothetical protein